MKIQSLFATKKRNAACWLIAILSCFFIIAAKYQNKTISIVPAKNCQYKAIIFDLGEVLLTTSSSSKATLFIRTTLKNPTLFYHIVGLDIKNEFFKLLHNIPAQTTEPMYNQGKKLPQIMVDWMTGRNIHEIAELVNIEIAKSSHSSSMKNLFKAIAHLMFNAQTLAHSQTPITSMVKLVKKLKHHGYKLYVLSNWESSSYQLVKKQNPKLFSLFDGIMISGEEKIGKPSPELYKKLLEKYNLNAESCVFIDDEINNVQAAQQLGIQSIICRNTPSVCLGFINLGIMTLA